MRIKPRNRKEKLNLILYCAVTLSFIVPIVFLIFKLIVGDAPENEVGYHSDADYALMLAQCVLGLLVINIPLLLAKQFRFKLPMFLYAMYIIFLYCAIFLGEVFDFYYVLPHWDIILHGFSGMMLSALGFILVDLLNRSADVRVSLSPFFESMFAFCFALALGAIWEIYEFSFDALLGLNMQKALTEEGVALMGREALRDTMEDIMVDAVAALAVAIAGYRVNRQKKTAESGEAAVAAEGRP